MIRSNSNWAIRHSLRRSHNKDCFCDRGKADTPMAQALRPPTVPPRLRLQHCNQHVCVEFRSDFCNCSVRGDNTVALPWGNPQPHDRKSETGKWLGVKGVLPEAAFRRMLLFERSRSDRTQRMFALLLLNMG